MDITQEDAQESLNQIKAASIRTRRAIAASYASGLLILWGAIWSLAAIGTHFYIEWAGYIWTALDVVGIAGTILIVRGQFRTANTKRITQAKNEYCRVFGLWAAMLVYAIIWLYMFRPVSGLLMNAFLCTTCMFVYIVIGLWFEGYFMVWLGLAMTGVILAGLYIIPHGYYNLWTAVFGGGAVLGTGLYIRIYWKK